MTPATPGPATILRGPQQPELLREETLADLFEHTAAHQPKQLALTIGDRQLHYGELDALADAVAHRLIDTHGVGPGTIVGLWLPRGIEQLVLQLAIAKTGAAWLPLDAQTPPDRVLTCLADAQAVALVTGDMPHRGLEPMPAGVSLIDAHALCASLPPGAMLRRRAGASTADTAYVIYTSGSTGKPKGIAISQRSICHFLRSEDARLGVQADHRPPSAQLRVDGDPADCRRGLGRRHTGAASTAAAR